MAATRAATKNATADPELPVILKNLNLIILSPPLPKLCYPIEVCLINSSTMVKVTHYIMPRALSSRYLLIVFTVSDSGVVNTA